MARPFLPTRPGLFRRTPPAIFPPIMGLFGLGLALRRGLDAAGLPVAPAELVLGGVSLLWAFGVLAYGIKVARRPAVVAEDLRILPGRAGLAAMTLCLLLLAVVLLPMSAGAARAALVAGLVAHGGLAVLIVRAIRLSPPEARDVTPVWHLSFVGFIIGAMSAVPLGHQALATLIFWTTLAVAVAVWGVSAVQLLRRIPPAPLRPLLAIHLAPAALLGQVALYLGYGTAAQLFAILGAAILVALVAAVRWLTAAGFSALWGAFTFPLAAYASLLLMLGGPWLWPGMAVLIAALGVVPPIAYQVMKAWASGQLAARTNAATA